jgi:hypothetical protein
MNALPVKFTEGSSDSGTEEVKGVRHLWAHHIQT